MNKKECTVILITGRTGVGKSTLLDRFAKKHKGCVQLFRPNNFSGDLFDLSAVDWVNHAAVVVDEVELWDRASIRSSIRTLEAESSTNGKKLILVSIAPSDLDYCGIGLAARYLVFELGAPSNVSSLPFSFDGSQVHFKHEVCTERFSTMTPDEFTAVSERTTLVAAGTINWTPAMDAILGTDRDAVIAGKFGLSAHQITARRKVLGIKGYSLPQKEWSPEEDAVLGTDTLMKVSVLLGRPISQIQKRMLELNVVGYKKSIIPPSQKTIDRERDKLEQGLRKFSRYYEKLQQGADIAEGILMEKSFKSIAQGLGISSSSTIARFKSFLLIMRSPEKLGDLIPSGYWRSVPFSVLKEAVRVARIEIEQRKQ